MKTLVLHWKNKTLIRKLMRKSLMTLFMRILIILKMMIWEGREDYWCQQTSALWVIDFIKNKKVLCMNMKPLVAMGSISTGKCFYYLVKINSLTINLDYYLQLKINLIGLIPNRPILSNEFSFIVSFMIFSWNSMVICLLIVWGWIKVFILLR